MKKVNEFEYDIDARNAYDMLKNPQANIIYTYDSSANELINDLDAISKYIKHHLEYQRPRLVTLNNYYDGLNINIMQSKRRKEEHLADNRAAHDYASYISDFVNGYFLGNPIQIVSDDGEVIDILNDLHDLNDIDTLNRSLGLDLSIYGRAYEYMVRTDKDQIKLYKSNALNTFIIFDNTVEQNSLAAVRYWQSQMVEGNDDHYNVDVITDSFTYRFKTSKTKAMKLEERESPEPHLFGKVTITEYRNNERRRGDFEKVVSLIDLYDNAQSDTANYMSDLNDAMLIIKGSVNFSPEEVKKQKEANVLFLEPPIYEDTEMRTSEGNVDAGYIYKQYDVSGTEAYKKRIDDDIHMFTNTPNMKDEKFSGTQSGEAMKYKLFGLEQRTKIKEGLFEKALNRRYKLIETMLKITRELNNNKTLHDLRFVFNRNLPKSIIDELNAYVSAGGRLSQETLMSVLSFIQDPQLELEKIKQEEEIERKHQDNNLYNDFEQKTELEKE